MYSEYEIVFSDGTTTLVTVSEDETPAEAAIALCESEGWNASEITGIVWTGEACDSDGWYDANA